MSPGWVRAHRELGPASIQMAKMEAGEGEVSWKRNQLCQLKGDIKRKVKHITLLEIEQQPLYTLQQLLQNGFNLHIQINTVWLLHVDQ